MSFGETQILAQSNPAASTLTDLLTVSGGMVTAAAIHACNQATGSIAVRIAIAPGGEADAAKHYIAYDVIVGPGRTLIIDFTRGLKLGNGTIVRVQADSASASFSVIGG